MHTTCLIGVNRAAFGSRNRFDGIVAGDIASYEKRREEWEYLFGVQWREFKTEVSFYHRSSSPRIKSTSGKPRVHILGLGFVCAGGGGVADGGGGGSRSTMNGNSACMALLSSATARLLRTVYMKSEVVFSKII
jgi:hypothetical protein